MRILLLLVIMLFFLSCSDSDTAGATGVGNPTEVALVAATGDVTGEGGFENESRRSNSTTIQDKVREFTFTSIEIQVDTFTWEVDTTTLEDNLDSNLTLKGNQLYYYGPVIFNAINANSTLLNLRMPTAAYKVIRFYIGKEDETETTIVAKGTYKNDAGESVPFTLNMPYGIELKFMKHGKPYLWERDSKVRLDLLLDMDEWFADVDLLKEIGVSSDATDEVLATLTSKAVWKRIKDCGVLSIYEK